MRVHIPKSHPRYESLIIREKLVKAVASGIVAIQGLIAHGRGEAFDYILGEKTHSFAIEAERAAVASMLLAKNPVISVNGNTAVLAPKEIAELANLIDANVEINIFHFSKKRIRRIKEYLKRFAIKPLDSCDAVLEGLESSRRIVDRRGIYVADVVLVPLEDGDRCEILKTHGKKVIAIDLNPLSRTALMADITIVDNVTRAFRNMVEFARELRGASKSYLSEILAGYDNNKILRDSIIEICNYLKKKADEVMSKQ